MANFKKAYNFKILALGVISIFLSNGVLYANALRIPVNQGTMHERMKAAEQAVKGVFVPDPGEIAEPLTKIAQHEQVRNILVFSPIDGVLFEQKLGETLINIYSLVVGLHKKFPGANIYVASPKNEIFFAQQFNGKIIPVPIESTEEFAGKAISNDPAYYAKWRRDYTVKNICSVLTRRTGAGEAKKLMKDFISDNGIDIVFDVGIVPGYFNNLIAGIIKDEPGYNRPHIFEISKPTLLPVAQSPNISGDLKGPVYIDRNEQSHEVSGFKDEFDKLAPDSYLVPKALWNISIAICKLLGLDISADNLPSIELSPYEATGAWIWLNNNLLSGALDVNKKTVVINLYAQTQQYLLREDEWLYDVIMPLMENMRNSYFIFTRGEPGKEDPALAQSMVDRIRRDIDARKSNGQAPGINPDNIILLPKATRDLYPYINGILGLADVMVTLDTGMSHLANGVYGIDTILINKPSIKQWETPRGNLSSVSVYGHGEDERDPFRKRIKNIALEMNSKPKRLAAKNAETGALSAYYRRFMDKDLIAKKISLPEAEKDLKEFIVDYSLAIGKTFPMFLEHYKKVMVPEIVFVDSAAQIGINLPRFLTKLYTDDQGKTYLLVDISALSDGLVRKEVKELSIVHEIFGHLLLRNIFSEFKKVEAKRASDPGLLNGSLNIEVEEEALARIGAIKTALIVGQSKPGWVDGLIKDKILPQDIKERADDMEYITNFVIGQMLQWIDYFDSLGTIRYSSILSIPNNRKHITERVMSKVSFIKGLFGADQITPTALQSPPARTSI